MNLQNQQQAAAAAVEQIPEALVQKFDNDRELVTEFVKEGYTVDELSKSDITHPTKFDPVVTLKDGHTAGFWIEKDDDNSLYNPRSFEYRHS